MGIAARRNPLFYARCGAKVFFDKLKQLNALRIQLLCYASYGWDGSRPTPRVSGS